MKSEATGHIELIEKYLSNELSSEELLHFENLLNANVISQVDIEEYKQLKSKLKSYGKIKSLKHKLNQYHKDIETDRKLVLNSRKTISKKEKYKIFAFAASLTLIISIGSWLMNINSHNKATKASKAQYTELRREVDKMKQSQSQIINEIGKVKKVVAPANFSGTGFAISKNGYIVTSAHLLRKSDSVFIENDKFGRLKMEKILIDQALDIAVLKIKDSSFTEFNNIPFTWEKNRTSLSEKVYTLGYPKQDIVYGEGYISSLNGYDGDTISYQFTLPVNPGHSGAPLFNQKGNILGMVSGKHNVLEGSAFALKTPYILDIIGQNDSLSAELKPNYNKVNGYNRTTAINKIKDYIFIVNVY